MPITKAGQRLLKKYFYLAAAERRGSGIQSSLPTTHAGMRAVTSTTAGIVNLAFSDRGRDGHRADALIDQANVTSCQIRKERALNIRWLADRSRCRPTRKRFWMTPWTDRNRCA